MLREEKVNICVVQILAAAAWASVDIRNFYAQPELCLLRWQRGCRYDDTHLALAAWPGVTCWVMNDAL